MGLAGRRVGGVLGMHAVIGTGDLPAGHQQSLPARSIDHHNAQFALVAIMTAMLLDEDNGR
jgi:hypothetical protein